MTTKSAADIRVRNSPQLGGHLNPQTSRVSITLFYCEDVLIGIRVSIKEVCIEGEEKLNGAL